jgi:hypothetical protein
MVPDHVPAIPTGCAKVVVSISAQQEASKSAGARAFVGKLRIVIVFDYSSDYGDRHKLRTQFPMVLFAVSSRGGFSVTFASHPK